MALLNRDEYLATMGGSRERVPHDAAPLMDFWPYVDAIDGSELRGYRFSSGRVMNAFNIDGGRWQHVLLDSTVPQVHLVIVIDGTRASVHGHYLLDLLAEYGVERPSSN